MQKQNGKTEGAPTPTVEVKKVGKCNRGVVLIDDKCKWYDSPGGCFYRGKLRGCLEHYKGKIRGEAGI